MILKCLYIRFCNQGGYTILSSPEAEETTMQNLPSSASLSYAEHAKFVSILNFFETKSADDISTLYQLAGRNVTEPNMSKIPRLFRRIKTCAETVLPYFNASSFESSHSLIKIIRDSISYADNIGISTIESNPNIFLPDIQVLHDNLSSISFELEDLILFVTTFERFVYSPQSATEPASAPRSVTEEVEKALRMYIKIGKKICSEPNFSDSPIGRLETLISNMHRVTVETDIRNPDKFPNNLLLTRTFIALVAPSLCGKTQSAFAMQHVRPLYFVLHDTSDTEEPNQQNVYRNFDSLVTTLESCAKKDLNAVVASGHKKLKFEPADMDEKESLNSLSSSSRHEIVKVETADFDEKAPLDVETETDLEEKEDYNSSIYALLNSRFLEKNHQNTPFFILGFLVKLMEEAENGFRPDASSNLFPDEKITWMEYHALRTGQRSVLHFKSITIAEAKQRAHLFEKYFIFLDEFVGYHWAVLIRNLCRAVGIRVLVANTNSDIVNLTGKKHARKSRNEDEDEVWALVVTRLNAPSFDAIENVLIMSNDDRNEMDALRELVTNLQNIQLPSLRPGIAYMVLDAMKTLVREAKVHSVCQVLDSICNEVGKALKNRKRRIHEESDGLLANLGLSLNGAYLKEGIDTNNPLLHRTSYLMDHLYYLVNPVENTDWLFMTFYPSKTTAFGKSLRIFKNGALRPWLAETTYFEEKEMLTILACMSIRSEYSAFDVLSQGQLNQISGNADVGASPNPEAVKLDGNRLEVLTSVSLIDSSHHGLGRSDITLAGQSGDTFVNNFAYNLIENSSERGNLRNLPPAFPEILNSILESFHVPFLYVSNMEVPEILQDLTAKGFVNVGLCRRTTDNEKIDVKFQIDIGGEKFWGVAECKNWQNDIQIYQLKEIILKAADSENTFISLIVCNSILDRSNTNWATLNTFATSERCNIYRLQGLEIDGSSATLQWTPVAETTDTPILVVFIYELDIINYRRN